jgi:hypothetical protein
MMLSGPCYLLAPATQHMSLQLIQCFAVIYDVQFFFPAQRINLRCLLL